MEQALAARPRGVVRTVEWPCLVLDVAGGGAVVHQVIARSFHGTRIHHHQYGMPTLVDVAGVGEWTATPLARQAALETGTASTLPESPELESFRSHVRAAHLEGPTP
jgi:hypothetical protein